MTVKEAIRELEYDKELYNTDAQGKPLDLELLEGTPDGLLVDALDMAIEALRKQEPVRPKKAPGLIREFETEEERTQWLKENVNYFSDGGYLDDGRRIGIWEW